MYRPQNVRPKNSNDWEVGTSCTSFLNSCKYLIQTQIS